MAKVLSSISGNLISAASAGYAPTNSADVSAIASAYQVVSSTATQLYAWTAYLTSVNSAPLSASRAGNAANASMANSAYYDGTGRLISSLPDSAAVSAIASAYATAKVDKSSISAQSSNWNSVYNTVSSNSASWSGSTGGGTVTSPSGTIFVKDGTAIEGTNSAVVVGQTSVGKTSILPPQGNAIGPTGMGVLTYALLSDSGMNLVFMIEGAYHGNDATVIISGRDYTWNFASASGLIVDGDISANIPLGTVQSQLSASSDYWINLMNGEDLSGVKAPGYAVTGVGELAWKSAVDNVTDTVSANSATWGQGGVNSATVSAIASAYQVVSSTASGSGEIFGQTAYYATEINGLTLSAQEASLATYATNAGSAGAAPTNSSEVSAIASGYASGKADASALSSYALSADVSGVIDTVSANSASWTTDLTDYATTAYVDSSVSSKADSSALSSYALSADVSGTIDTVSSNSATWGAGGIDSATCSAIASSYANDVSAAVSGTVDTVSAQSANWGGSALALSAGPGVKLTKSGNTLVASTDETVLWENTAGRLLANGITLSESRLNFEMLRFYMAAQIGKSVISYDMPMCGLNRTTAFAIQPSMPFTDAATTGFAINWQIAITATDSTMASVQALYWGKNNFGSANSASGSWTQGANNGGIPAVYKVIGINRTAGV